MGTETTGSAKLFAKLAAVMGEIRTLEKTGRNAYDRYDYVTADAIATKIGAALARHNVAFLPSLVSVETSEYTTAKGGSNFRTVVNMQLTFACGETGAVWSSLWSGEAIDRSDKSISKAAVSAVKYALLKTFLLAGGDEEEADASSPTVRSDAVADTGVNGDVVFDQPAKPRASKAHLAELDAVGVQYYGAEWAQQCPRLCEAVSKGATTDAAELVESEITRLINGIRSKLAAHANGVAA